jgi:predicted RNA-binding protein with PIN domain
VAGELGRSGAPVRWIVDGMNVIGSRPTGWWRDRRGAMEKLVEELGDHAAATGEAVTVVFDGEPFELRSKPDAVEVAFASRRGPDAADDEIVERVTRDPRPEALRVVTSDSRLAERVRAEGATVVSAGRFRRRLDEGRGETLP